MSRPLTSFAEPRSSLARDCVAIVLTGAVLGLAFNQVGLTRRHPDGLPWIGFATPLERLDYPSQAIDNSTRPAPAPIASPASRAETPAGPATEASREPTAVEPRPGLWAAAVEESHEDPSGDPTLAATADLPTIPDVGRPLEVNFETVARFVAARAALVLDARDRGTFVGGHIPGAINVPYEEAVRDPTTLHAVDPKSRPVIVYCSGGDCEASRMLAEMLTGQLGMRRVLVYKAGFPEWVASGMKVER